MKDRKKKGGRPAIENKKQFRINVRFDESEHNRVLHNAKIAGMSKSEWCVNLRYCERSYRGLPKNNCKLLGRLQELLTTLTS